MLEDGGVGDGASVVGFREGGVKLEGAICVGDGVSIRFGFDVGLFGEEGGQ